MAWRRTWRSGRLAGGGREPTERGRTVTQTYAARWPVLDSGGLLVSKHIKLEIDVELIRQ